jgi:hypothetical protein
MNSFTFYRFIYTILNDISSAPIADTILRDCLTRWICLLMTCMVNLCLNTVGDGPFFAIFFSCFNDFITQKVYFSRLMRVYVGMLAACT